MAIIDNMDAGKWCMAHFRAAFINNPPDVPYNPNPDNGAIDVPYENTSFSWSASDLDGDVLNYNFYICNAWDAEVGCIGTVNTVSNLSDPLYVLPDPLTPSSQYWWWVEACDANICTSSPVWTFYTASAPAIMYDLTVSVNPADGGSITGQGLSCPGDCSESYEEGTDITITANPAEGYVFLNWSGDCSACGNNTTCTINMDVDKNCAANFELGNQPPCAPQNPNPADGATGVDYHQVNFSWQATDPDGDVLTYNFYFGQPSDGSCIFSIQQNGLTQPSYIMSNLEVKRTFCWKVEACDAEQCTAGPIWSFTTQDLIFYTISVNINPEGGGSIIDTQGSINCPDEYCVLGYGEGRSVTLEATAASGYQFVEWSGDCAFCSDNATCNFVMDSDKSCTANFEEIVTGPQPDLVITRLVASRFWRYGRTTRVSILIKNQGDADITGPFTVTLFADHTIPGNEIAAQTVNGLAAGQKKLIRFRVQAPDNLCTPTNIHKLIAVLDTDQAITESDETNNEASKNIVIRSCP